MKLVIERPHLPIEYHNWEIGTQKRYHFDSDDLAVLNSSEILWRGDTAFYLEED